jgi:hypothetical protein
MGAVIAGSATAATATSLADMDVNMDVVGQINYHFDERPATADSMDLSRLRITLKAQPADNVKFVANLEAADDVTARNAFGDNTPSNALLTDMGADGRVADMYVVLTYLDWVTILAGQMPTPVSYELNTNVYDLETVQYSQFVGIANRDRGVGFVIPIPNANTEFIGWLLNGTGGINGAIDDVDDRNNYGAMLNFKPMENLSFKVFGNFGDMSSDTGTLPGTAAGNMGELDVDAYGGGFDYSNQGFHLFGEYVRAKSVVDSTTPLGVSTRILSHKATEWYLHGSYKIPESDVQLVARFDKYNPEATPTLGTLNSTDSKIFTAGLNWDFEKNARVQIMREFNSGLINNQDELDIQLSVRF